MPWRTETQMEQRQILAILAKTGEFELSPTPGLRRVGSRWGQGVNPRQQRGRSHAPRSFRSTQAWSAFELRPVAPAIPSHCLADRHEHGTAIPVRVQIPVGEGVQRIQMAELKRFKPPLSPALRWGRCDRSEAEIGTIRWPERLALEALTRTCPRRRSDPRGKGHFFRTGSAAARSMSWFEGRLASRTLAALSRPATGSWLASSRPN